MYKNEWIVIKYKLNKFYAVLMNLMKFLAHLDEKKCTATTNTKKTAISEPKIINNQKSWLQTPKNHYQKFKNVHF